jgi:phage-related protein
MVVTPAQKEIQALPADLQARYLRLVEVIQEHGPGALGMPHARHVEGKLWELRLKGRDGIARALYVCAAHRRVVVLHAFVKKSQKTPRRAIETARRRWEEEGNEES